MEATPIRRPLGLLTSGTSEASTTSHSQHSVGQGCTKLNDEVYEVYRPASGSFSLEVVFFHGFQRGDFGDAERRATGTWTTKDGTCWLKTWLVERFPQARILAVSYDSGTQVSESEARMDMYLICENLVQSLIDLAGVGQSCPMVLVGHCIGGLVLKAVCVTCEERSRKQFLENLRGVFFYSTPHSGSQVPARASVDGGGLLLEYFAPLNKFSARINDNFIQLRHKYGWRTYSLFPANESRTSTLIHLIDEECNSSQNRAIIPGYISVVEEGSCRVDMDSFFTVLGEDHLTICNPLDPKSSSFLLLVHFLEEILLTEENCNSEILQHLRLPPHPLVSRRLDEVIRQLDLENPESIMLSLVGMDGIGKSTLAKQLLLRIRNQFDFLCFLEFEDIQANEAKGEALENLVVKSLFRGQGRKVSKVSLENKALWTLLRGKKVLVVADAVQSEQQIRPFITFNGYGGGSRLVITTCVKSLMSQYGFIEYAVPLMSPSEAAELFKGVMGNSLLEMVGDQEELVSKVIAECEGLPLPLQLLGCHLRKKLESVVPHPREEFVAGVWIDALRRMKTANALDGMGGNQVWRKLNVIFNQLDEPEKALFLDLAMFDYYGPKKKQYKMNHLRAAWEDVGLPRDIRPFVVSAIIENLIERCFLDYDYRRLSEPTIYMHPALRNMGRWISRQGAVRRNVENADDLWRLSEEGYNTTLETLSIMLERTESSPNAWKPGFVKKFAGLRLLRLSHVNMPEGCDGFLPPSLALLHMIRCSGPRQSPWERFVWRHVSWPLREEEVESLQRLSVLLLDHCNLVRLPPNFHRLKSLQVLRIEDESMTSLPKEFTLPQLQDFTLVAPVTSLPQSLLEMSRLERLKVGSKFLRTWPTPKEGYPSKHLTSLVKLELVDLSSLVKLPDSFGGMASLRWLFIKRCSALKRLPDGFDKLQQLKKLKIEDCGELEELSESFHNLCQLEWLSLSRLPALKTLPKSFGLLPLRDLTIRKCDTLEELPQSFLDFQSLVRCYITECERLVTLGQDLQDHNISTQSNGIQTLEKFHLACPAFRSLPESLFKFCIRKSFACRSRPSFTVIHGHPRMNLDFYDNTFLGVGYLEDLVHLPECISELKLLRQLQVYYCVNLRTLPWSVGELCALRELSVRGCSSLMTLPESIGQLPSLEELVIVTCCALKTLPESLGQIPSLSVLRIIDCTALVALPTALGQSLTELEIRDCTALLALPESIGQLTRLRSLRLRGCKSVVQLPKSTGNLRSVRDLDLSRCGVFSEFPFPYRRLKLKGLGLPAFEDSNTLLSVLQQVDPKELQDLEVDMSGVTITPAMLVCFGEFTSLRALKLFATPNLQALVESLVDIRTLEMRSGEAGQLTRLMIGVSGTLEILPEVIGQLESLQVLSINWCANLRALPDSLGQLKSLQYLEIVGCNKLESLPNSVGQLNRLKILRIESCANLEMLPDSIPQLEFVLLRIHDCGNLRSLPIFPRHIQIIRSRRYVAHPYESLIAGDFRWTSHPENIWIRSFKIRPSVRWSG